MTIELSELIYNVRAELSEVPDDMISDEQIFEEIITANLFIQSIIQEDYDDETFESRCIILLGSYFSYLNYISLVARQLGDVPADMYQREKTMRNKVLMFLRQISDVPLSDSLNIDEKLFGKIDSGGFYQTSGVWV